MRSTRRKQKLSTAAIVLVAACALAVPAGAADAAPGGGAGNGRLPDPPPFQPAAAPIPADATEYQRQLALAEIGREDGDGVMAPNWCFGSPQPPELSDQSTLGPAWLMDDAAYIGMVTVGQVALRTADGGFVLFDTLYNQDDVETLTKPGLAALGLDPEELRAVFVTHGHGDHNGGAKALQDEFGVPVYIGSADASAASYNATLIDSANPEPVDITVGGTTITALSTPGHTSGTVSFILPTTSGGQSHPMAYWGGSGLPSSAPLKNASEYMESAGRMWQLVRQTDADSSINSHTFFDQSENRIGEIIANGGIGSENPMVQGNDTVLRSFYVLRQCAAAAVAQRDATAKNPAWRMTGTDVYAATFVNAPSRGKQSVVKVGARLSNAFEVLTGQAITFTADGASCTATTGTGGVAECTLKVPAAASLTIKAAFAGSTSADGYLVDLPSDGSLTINR